MGSVTYELSKVIDVSTLSPDGNRFVLEPERDVLREIAKRFVVPKIESFKAEIIAKKTGMGADISGRIWAKLVRECVASLEEMDEVIDAKFEVSFDRSVSDEPPAQNTAENGEGDMSLDKSLEYLEGPEPLDGDLIDIGELAVQQLSLAMDPFPRKEGAVSLSEIYGKAKEGSPFDVLKEALNEKPDGKIQ